MGAVSWAPVPSRSARLQSFVCRARKILVSEDGNGDGTKDCAIVYDFDGTLAEANCVSHGLLEALGIRDEGAFWDEVKRLTKERDADEVLTYLGQLAFKAKVNGAREELSKERLRHHGRRIPLFPGVEGWFARINRFGAERGLRISHYIVSSGLQAMIEGTPIAGEFQKIFACRYHYDEETGHAKWPIVAVDYTGKTQYLFRINKGIENVWDHESINRYVEPDQRPQPFKRMIFVGDGDTDIPSMKMVRTQGGCSIAVFDREKWGEARTQEKIEKLIAENRVNYVVPADYSEGTQLDVTVKGVLRLFERRDAGE